VRCGAALERMPGRRADALAAYRRAPDNEAASKRVAVLEVARVVGAEGVSGVEKRSLDPRRMSPFEDAVGFLERAIPAHEYYDDTSRETTTESADARLALIRVARCVEKTVSSRAARGESGPFEVFVHPHGAEASVILRVLDGYKQLADVSDDGRRIETGESASDVPVLPVLYSSDFSRADGVRWTFPVPVLDMLRRMLEANSRLLSPEYRATVVEPESFRASVLTPICVVPPKLVVFELCAYPECTEEECQFRCGKCKLVRYCGAEHSAAHWRAHKPVCVPATQRPFVELVSTDGWGLVKRAADVFPCTEEGKVWPVEPVEGLALVKLICAQYDEGDMGLTICGQNGATAMRLTVGESIAEDALRELRVFMCTFGRAFDLREPVAIVVLVEGPTTVAYCDADLSEASSGRLRLHLDKAHNCIW
jgi:hypothetical protein